MPAAALLAVTDQDVAKIASDLVPDRAAQASSRRHPLTSEVAIILTVAYDEALADRIRALLATDHGVVEKKMFGGLAFLIGGNMSVSASGQGGLLLRCDPADTESLVSEPHADRFEMRGRAMDGWLRVESEGLETDDELQRWVAVGVSYARSLPPKS